MKQIVMVVGDRRRYENLVSNNDYYVKWCSFTLSDIMRLRDRSNVFFLCTDGEDPDTLKRIGLYFRDLCLEDEKFVCIYGEKTGVDILNYLIPSLYVIETGYFHTTSFDRIFEAIRIRDGINGRNKPGILIVDDDIDYIGKIRPYLESKFNIYVSHLDLREAGKMLYYSDALVISSKGKFTMNEMMDFFRAAVKRKKSGGLHVYFLTDDVMEQDRLNMDSEKNGIALSKTLEPARVAEYITNSVIP